MCSWSIAISGTPKCVRRVRYWHSGTHSRLDRLFSLRGRHVHAFSRRTPVYHLPTWPVAGAGSPKRVRGVRSWQGGIISRIDRLFSLRGWHIHAVKRRTPVRRLPSW